MRVLPLLLLAACAPNSALTPTPAATPSASISASGARFLLPLPSTATTSTRLLWVISWNQASLPRWGMGDFGLWVADTLPEAPLRLQDRLKHLSLNYYWLEPAGSITAIVSPTEPALLARAAGGRLELTLGPSTPLNQLLAWRPDSLRLDLAEVALAGSQPPFWIRPTYSP